jgi:3-oxoacyl-[acyl-carrier protein] reductase
MTSTRMHMKTAIVTGGGSGFGAGIAKKFASEGAKVMVADINLAAAEAIAEAIGGIAQRVDVTESASVEAMAEAAIAKFGALDVLVNNAGISHPAQPMENLSEEEFDRILSVNAKSIYLTTRHVVPYLKKTGKGAILNIASASAVSPRPNLAWYSASKGWIITATRAMAIELAPFGVRVNAVNPVAGETQLLANIMGENSTAMKEKCLTSIPLGRFVTPEDIGNAACFLCSDEASLMTGVAIEVDGGRCI